MLPKEIKALIDEHCMGIKDAGKISPEVMDLIMKTAEQKKADDEEVQKYMEEVISGPTKAEREAIAKAEAERKAKAEAERAEKERLAAIERAKREKREAAERAERERLAAIERAEKEKKEAAERAEREKKEAIFQELKKKYPTADISGIGHIQLYQKPIDKWEDEFKASAKQQAVKKRKQAFEKIKNIAYWVVFSILLIGAFVCEHLFVHGGWDSFLVVSLILVAFGTNAYYRLKGKEGDEDLYMVTTWCAGILWQHYFVHGTWWTILTIAIILAVPFIFNYQKHIKLARIVTWMIVILTLVSFSLFLFTDIESANTHESVEAVEPIENDDINTVESMPTDDNDTELSAEEEYERLKKQTEAEYERLKKETEAEYERMKKSSK